MAKEKENEVLNTSDRIALFIQANRKYLFAVLILIAAGIAGTILFYSIRNTLQKKAVVTLEGFEKRKKELGDLSDTAKSMEIQILLEELNNFAGSSFGYAAAKAYSMAADIYAARSEWASAEEAWAASAKKAPRIYLAPLSLYNAAAAAEEQGKLEEAVEYYTQSLAFEGNFPAAPRARFNTGRIHESRNDREAAAEAYRSLIEKGPSDSNWVKLAQTRMIILEME